MASPFASKVVATLAIPFDPPNEVTIRKLAGRHLERARNVFLTGLFLDVQARGGAAVQKDMQQLFKKDEKNDEAREQTEQQIKKLTDDPLNGLDPYEIARCGIVKWTYAEPLTLEESVDERGTITMRCRAIDDLDEDAVRWFATEVMRLTKPSLFQTTEEADADRKKD